MNIIRCDIEGLLIFEPQVFGDPRGYFMELYNQSRYDAAGLKARFVQDNISVSRQGILRGMHFQTPNAQGKLVSVLQGSVFDVAVDLRSSSSTFGKWHATELSSENRRQFYIPPGFGHGFQVLSEMAMFHYKCTEFYTPQSEMTLRWDDPQVGIRWPLANPVLSQKDSRGLLLRDIPRDRLFR
jgi:dTDP-4-dehydrorhamnose 3,5-epimerase